MSTYASEKQREARERKAIADARAAGFEPMAPYPGTADTPWPCRCSECGTEDSPRLSALRHP